MRMLSPFSEVRRTGAFRGCLGGIGQNPEMTISGEQAGTAPQQLGLRGVSLHLILVIVIFAMSCLVCIVLPLLVFRSIASNTPTCRYYWRLTVFLGSLVVVSTWGVAVAVGMTLVGRRNDVNYVVARTFYALASYALDIKVVVEGEEHLQTRPAVMVSNHQSMLDILCLGR